MKLVQITYYRKNNIKDIKTAIVTETQAEYLRGQLKHIRIISVKPVTDGSQRSYLLS